MADPDPVSRGRSGNQELPRETRLAPTNFTRKPAFQTVGDGRSSIRSTTGIKTPSSACTRRTDEFSTGGNTSARWPEQVRRRGGGGVRLGEEGRPKSRSRDVWIQLVVGPQPLWLRNHNFGLAHRIMVKRLATSPHDPLGITDSACKNQLVVVSVQYGPFNTYIPIRSTTIGKSRVARDPIAIHTSWRSNSDITSVTRTNQYNQDLGLIHSTNGNHLESPNEGSSIDHQVTIHLHTQNITMLPTNETWYFTSQMLVSSSGGLILILTAQSTRNEFRMHSDY
ncbi:triacylglycerol lipase [Dorcoceras hygrometricum]|uniref:Triacylglycerol lipase n=1 Tax=Dorcoceras hygrometricum TaxID=472368 RepID=A0A2Z7B4F8_9LAMI|nr:triacylglycerol lipase [Dorcoceras hygrometricum]